MSLEEMHELRGYRRLYATTNLLVLCVFLIWANLSLDLAQSSVPILTVALWSLFTLAYYGLLADRYFRRSLLFYGNLVNLSLATVLIWFSGRESSPFFFVYLLVIMSAAMAVGLGPCFALAGFASALYLVVSTAALHQLLAAPEQVLRGIFGLGAGGGVSFPLPWASADAPGLLAAPRVLLLALLHGVSQVWANLAALWLTAYVAGFFAREIRLARAAVLEAREKAEAFSRIDWLTGLYNRRHLDYLLTQEVGRAERYNRPLSLLLVDSDNLKVVNDGYGHQAGDRLLSTLAGALRDETRLSDTDLIGARFLAERLRAAVEATAFTWQGQRVKATVTIGVATLPQDAADPASLVARADAALYEGKRAGRNHVVTVAEAESTASAKSRES